MAGAQQARVHELSDDDDVAGDECLDREGDVSITPAGGRALDPRLALELEDEREDIELRLAAVADEIQKLLEEQDQLQRRRDDISARLAASWQQAEQRGEGRGCGQQGREGGSSEGNEEGKSGREGRVDRAAYWKGAFEWDGSVVRVMRDLFGIQSFRTNQREIINAVLSARDVFVIMPAGGGKSLCYQLPALLKGGVALVVSPLLSLIHDQVMHLKALGVDACMLTSATAKEEEKRVYTLLEKGPGGDLPLTSAPKRRKAAADVSGSSSSGMGGACLVYVTPEKVARSKRLISKLEKCNQGGRLQLIAIDEAHCCSQWGHDFRPDYSHLSLLKQQFPKVPLMALTATATERVQVDVREMLHMRRCETFVSSVNRPNLFYQVREKPSSAAALVDEMAAFISDSFSPHDSGIVYCFSRKECEQVAADLSHRGIAAEAYHAELPPEVKQSVHCRWSQGHLQVIVGTVAFGMGINKPDVRFVIHHTLSKSIETYYQESGRAGRDGLPSFCVLFYRCADVPRQSSMVFAETAGLLNLYAMARFCQTQDECRRTAIFRHFAEQPQDCHGMCDVCSEGSSSNLVDMTAEAVSLLAVVKQVAAEEKRVTMLQLADQFRSATRSSAKKAKLASAASAAAAGYHSRESIERLIVHLLLISVLKEEFQHTAYSTNAYLVAGRSSQRLLSGALQVKLHMPPDLHKKQGPVLNPSNNASDSSHSLRIVLEDALDAFRKKLAADHGGIFPHAVLSSQHVKHLSSSWPLTSKQVASIIGQCKAKQFGEELFSVLKNAVDKHERGEAVVEPQWISVNHKRKHDGIDEVPLANLKKKTNSRKH